MIRITQDILRPSNAISIFPDDVRRIMKGTGLLWDDVAQPDIYSCLSVGENMLAIGWILRRNDAGDCIFYRKNACTIYEWRPMICRCYPFFMNERGIEVMRCEGLGNKIIEQTAQEIGYIVKRYEIKKLQSYISIMEQIGDMMDLANLCSLPQDYPGSVPVYDGESIIAATVERKVKA